MNSSTTIQRHWPAMLIGSMWLWMFWPMIGGQTVCGFRDSAYLYYPLFKWIDSVWASGEIPLWNPYCNYGLPVVGDGSSSVFYPGKLIFLCRFLSYPSRYGIYLSVHILIAAAGAYRFARVMKANQAGATLAAISYAFGGSVLFQLCNVIYLVSAAWLPFALMFVWKGVIGNHWRAAVLAGVVCALMILGGDPQMVYHVGLIAAASVIGTFWQRRRWLLNNSRVSSSEAYRWLMSAGARLLLMIVVTSSLAAIQILPTAHWAARSERAASGEILNLLHASKHAQTVSEPNFKMDSNLWGNGYSINNLGSTIFHAFFESPAPGSQKDATYQFSQPPWSLVELFFPNVMGKPFPIHERWSDALPAAERIWTPSVYVGVLTVLLALPQFRLWGKRRRLVWLCRVATFFAVASFGWFGLVWLLNEGLAVAGLRPLVIGETKIGAQVGGLYWFMAAVLPKYFMFRYPAKLFVIASLLMSVLAGFGLSQFSSQRSVRERIGAVSEARRFARASSLNAAWVVSLLCIAGLIGLQLAPVELWLGRTRPNLLFGPLDVAGTVFSLNVAFAQPLIVAVSFMLIVWLTKISCKTESAFKFAAATVTLLTAFDICAANHWMLAGVDSSVFESPTAIKQELDKLKANRPDAIPLVYRSIEVQARNEKWPYESSQNRLGEIVHWQRETLFPKHHLEHQVALLGSFGSVWPSDYKFHTHHLNLEFAEKGYLLVPMPTRYRLAGQMVAGGANDSLTLKPEEGRRKSAELLPALNRWNRSFSALDGPVHSAFPSGAQPEIESIDWSTRSIAAEIRAEQDVRLQVCVLHDDGWRAVSRDPISETKTSLTITPSRDQIGMTVNLPPGHHHVTFVYSPSEFWFGLWISGFSWSALAAAFTFRKKIWSRFR